jgi:hypothetical protein
MKEFPKIKDYPTSREWYEAARESYCQNLIAAKEMRDQWRDHFIALDDPTRVQANEYRKLDHEIATCIGLLRSGLRKAEAALRLENWQHIPMQTEEQPDKQYLPNPLNLFGALSTRQDREECFTKMTEEDLLLMAEGLRGDITINQEWIDAIEEHIRTRRSQRPQS